MRRNDNDILNDILCKIDNNKCIEKITNCNRLPIQFQFAGGKIIKKRITKQRRKLTKKRITKNRRKNRTNKTKKRRFRHKRRNTAKK